ncbi:MAG: precorrin-8X methylmutase [Ruminococcus sp.]|nr:precorrin-8X methylmutase [Ruminococcus sp.]
MEFVRPEDIEKRSFEIIREELGDRVLPEGTESVIMRCIHATADFDYAENMYFSPGAMERAGELIRAGAAIVTDTNMAKAGVNKRITEKFGCSCLCFMADRDVAETAKKRGVTRAAVSAEKAAEITGPLIYAVGNAPTALIRICELIRSGELEPGLVIGAPVGFVNVIQSKELLIETARISGTECIVPRGRKGGSTVAAAILNALLMEAEGDM